MLYHKQGSLHTYHSFSLLHSMDLDVSPHCSLLGEITTLGIDHGKFDQMRTPGSEIRQLLGELIYTTAGS